MKASLCHVRKHHNRFSFRFTLLGKYVDAGESYETEELAAAAADTAKFHLRNRFSIDLPASLDGENFSSIAYSKLGINLSDSSAVEKALAPGVSAFIDANRPALEAHRDSQPEESLASKIRRSGAYSRQPELQQWVAQCEVAEERGKAFAAINGEYLNSLLGSLSNRLTDCAGPVNRAVKMHERSLSDPDLVTFREKLRELAVHIADTANYVEQLRREHEEKRAQVFSALQTLEANRPPLT